MDVPRLFSSLIVLTLSVVIVEALTTRAAEVPPAAADSESSRHLTQEEIEAGWLELFDGESLFGWRNEGDANFRVEKGEIIADEGSAPCLLRTTSQFDEYHLQLEFLAAEQTNSGVFLRTPPRPTNPAGDCIEVNIATAALSPFTTGAVVARQTTQAEVASEAWHRFDLIVQRDQVVIQVDGVETARLGSILPQGRGYIGLQYNSGPIRFRNVFLLPLGLEPLPTDPNDPAWRPQMGAALQATSTDSGSLHLRRGPGHLETQAEFDDFILQIEAQTNGADVNSGVFFRCIPGSQLDGYEAQINHEVVAGNPDQPQDFGTGGIFRRQAARRVETQDQKPFSMTILAEGPHIATWVDGRQVVDWNDQRPANRNPRRGRSLETGTLALQAHDAQTDIEFRSLRIKSLQARKR